MKHIQDLRNISFLYDLICDKMNDVHLFSLFIHIVLFVNRTFLLFGIFAVDLFTFYILVYLQWHPVYIIHYTLENDEIGLFPKISIRSFGSLIIE